MLKQKLFLLAALAAFLAIDAGAWSLFGSKEGALRNRLSSADKLMARADAAYEAGDMARASALYNRALGLYGQVNTADATFMEGIAAHRITYCASQYTNAMAAVELRDDPNAQDAEDEGDDEEEDDEEGEEPAPLRNAPSAQPVEPRDDPSRVEYDMRNYAHDMSEAKMLIEDGNLSAAASILIPILRHDPTDREVRLLIAVVRTRQGRFDEAIVALEDMRGRREDLPVLLALSGAYAGAGRHHDALLALDGAIKLAPSDPNAYMNLAWLTLAMPSDADTLKTAETYYRQAIKRGAARDRALESRIGLTKW